MLQEVSDENGRIGRKDKGDGCRQHTYKREQCAYRKCSGLRVLGTTLQPQRKEPGQIDTTKNHDRLGGILQTYEYLQKQQLMCADSYDIWCRYMDTDQISTRQNRIAQMLARKWLLNTIFTTAYLFIF